MDFSINNQLIYKLKIWASIMVGLKKVIVRMQKFGERKNLFIKILSRGVNYEI